MVSIVPADVAIAVYTIAIAYLQDAKVANNGLVSRVKAEQVSPSYFYIWSLEQDGKGQTRNTPAAACTYEVKSKTWLVELMTGQKLALHDNHDVWEIVRKGRK